LLNITRFEDAMPFFIMKRLLSVAGYAQLGPIERPPSHLVTMRFVNGTNLFDVKIDNSGMVAAMGQGEGYDDQFERPAS
jgi:hypothetical protein